MHANQRMDTRRRQIAATFLADLPSERGLWVVEQRGLEMSLRLIFGQAE
jgi:hypothetical protein